MQRIVFLALTALLLSFTSNASGKDERCFEMRTYFAAPGKLEALHQRFRDHTCRLFEKHGMQNIGYWAPIDNTENKLVFILAHPNREARERAWQKFMDDPEWKSAYEASHRDGPLVTRAEILFLTATDYSPAIKPAARPPRVFELRTYTASPGNLDHLHARFRNHTVKLFSKHGMEHFGYWTPMDKDKGAEDTLIYILSHKSQEAGAASFGTFRNDPDWIAARKASEEKAGGSLTAPGGVKSLYMKATDYSPTK